MQGSPELDRLKEYVRALADERAQIGPSICASSGQLGVRSAAFAGRRRGGLLSRASESERSAVPIEREVAVDNPQRFGPEVDFADVVRLESELDGVAGTRIELHGSLATLKICNTSRTAVGDPL